MAAKTNQMQCSRKHPAPDISRTRKEGRGNNERDSRPNKQQKSVQRLGVVENDFNLSTGEAEANWSLCVKSQNGLHKVPGSQGYVERRCLKKKKRKKKVTTG